MGQFAIVVVSAEEKKEAPEYIDQSVFDCRVVTRPDSLTASSSESVNLLLCDREFNHESESAFLSDLVAAADRLSVPLVLRSQEHGLRDNIAALEFGIDDIVPPSTPRDEMTTRLLSQIYHRIANVQLKSTLDQAHQAAFSAMKESSNLGANIHFLLQTYQCTNLDQLGQAFFRAVSGYGLVCSLQMRSQFETKNMEANGMSRSLEAELLTQLKDAGRYYDFGQRSVVNYGAVSVLIKNMPANDLEYGMVKDNTFTLLQGLDACVRSLDKTCLLQSQKESLLSLSVSVKEAMKGIESEFHQVTRRIVDVVEHAAEVIDIRLPAMLLNEDQENFIADTMQHCVQDANRVFGDGLRVDKFFQVVVEHVDRSLQEIDKETPAVLESTSNETRSADDVELF